MLSKICVSALVLVGLVGCGRGREIGPSGSVTPAKAPLTIASVVGEYSLVAVDGRALPYVPRSRAASASLARPVTSGSLTVNANGTFRLQTVYDQPGDSGGSAMAFAGACYAEGDQVKMVWDGGGLTNITLRGDTVVINREGALYGYLRSR